MKKKVAVVIGGLKGIGKAISLDLIDKGFITYATTREKSAAVNIENLVPVQVNVLNEKEIQDLFTLISEQHGTLDVLVNNAGIGEFKAFEEFNSKEWEDVFRTNVFGMFHCTQNAFPLLKKRGGRIINISSFMTKRSLPTQSVYTASKQAVSGLGNVLAEEWYKHHIFTTNIQLGATYTDIWKDIEGFSSEDMLQAHDVARVISFVAMTPLHVRMDEITLTPPKGVL
ncbi:SDR family oxidoreductase [Domibacillus sp. DTU_2020_1001157_1_SI_ALB_TIR_016]|uniref:SDR family oxidoreductase n=1 Tax=Domibacillus sp. DTU_2020_1001157_1_SI_ALB_TIR_016 TaxID=3077789 RepID=UPI0028EC87B0|nr:SDR family oxidoreductase [Domibacillus sp. DTU_2020_1001157_1_SI_ALB_TIR_016]WNS78957.1 SDR family oxidoreductase [Domibacillus sp. DTU_2020_1001157_1_SI_ALB_TIR_016]